MLKKDRISKIEMFSDEWKVARLGKFTSSTISKLMQEKSYATGFMNYMYEKVGEELSGKPAVEYDAIDTDAMRWGRMYEKDALTKFGHLKGLEYLIVQQLIAVPETRFGSTPDALIPHSESTDGTAHNVSTVEAKCFPTYQNYIPLALCKTPAEIKKVNPSLFWQVLDQMDNCDCLIGYSVAYHPELMAGNLSVVEFRKINLVPELNLLKERKKMASEKFDEIREQLIKMGKF